MKHLREPAILIALYMAPGLVATLGGESVPAQVSALLSVTLRNLAFLLLLLYLLDIRGEREVVLALHGRRLRAVTTAVSAAGVACLLLCLSVLVGLTAAAVPGFDYPASASTGAIVASVQAHLHPFLVVPALTLSMVVVAYTEEVFFRAYLPARLRASGLPAAQAVVIAAILFSLGHGWQGPAAVGFSLASGLALGALWVHKPRIHVLAIGHALYNLLILVLAG